VEVLEGRKTEVWGWGCVGAEEGAGMGVGVGAGDGVEVVVGSMDSDMALKGGGEEGRRGGSSRNELRWPGPPRPNEMVVREGL